MIKIYRDAHRSSTPGDYGIDIIPSKGVFISYDVFDALVSRQIKYIDDFYAFVHHFLGVVSEKLHWSSDNVETANAKLRTDLQGLISFDQKEYKVVYGVGTVDDVRN